MYRTANLDRELNDAIDFANDFDALFYRISEYDYSVGGVLNITMNKLFDKSFTNNLQFEITDQQRTQLLKMFLDNGLDVNDNSNNFSLGHSIVRSSPANLIAVLMKSKFKFNSYTKMPKWHSLELLQLNLLGPSTSSEDQKKILKIIEIQLNKGVNLDETTPKDFFEKLNRNFKSSAFKPLLELYNNDRYMSDYFRRHTNVIIDNELNNLISEAARNIFIF